VKKLLIVGAVLGAAALGVKRLTGAWPDPRSLREDFPGEVQRIKGALAEAVSAGRRAAAAREAEFERELAAAAAR
jgi:hypothetical protein